MLLLDKSEDCKVSLPGDEYSVLVDIAGVS